MGEKGEKEREGGREGGRVGGREGGREGGGEEERERGGGQGGQSKHHPGSLKQKSEIRVDQSFTVKTQYFNEPVNVSVMV